TQVIERQSLVDQFAEDPSIGVFLLSTKAGGFGLNLTAANVVILFDLDFNPHNDAQAEDRAYRLGQTRDVRVVRLVLRGTVEEYVLKLGDAKLNLDRSLQSGAPPPPSSSLAPGDAVAPVLTGVDDGAEDGVNDDDAAAADGADEEGNGGAADAVAQRAADHKLLAMLRSEWAVVGPAGRAAARPGPPDEGDGSPVSR
ncbi:hypothetical protein HK405_002015, partial [Cladochytrium tenue]